MRNHFVQMIGHTAVLCMALLILPFMTALANGQPDAFDAALERRYTNDGWQVTSSTHSSLSGAAILTRGDEQMLAILFHEENGWQEKYTNPNAVFFGFSGTCSVGMDNDDLLILSFTPENAAYTPVYQQYYALSNGNWLLDSVMQYDPPVNEEYRTEHCGYIQNGMLRSKHFLTDQEGNLLHSQHQASLPNVLTDDERDLRAINNMNPPFGGTGYTMDESQMLAVSVMERLFHSFFPDGPRYIAGIYNPGSISTLVFLVDKKDGSRVVLCGSCASTDQWQFTESAPLPAGSSMGYENFGNVLMIGDQGYGFSLTQFADGRWGASTAFSADGSLFVIGENWISDGGLWNTSSPVIGNHPWSDITQPGWVSPIPSIASAYTSVDSSGWATPNNANPEDRLHLRLKASKDSPSLGKYYNGTPVQVISRGSEWSHVRIGKTEGYMMTKHLAFGSATRKVEPHLGEKQAKEALTKVLWDDEKSPITLTRDETACLVVVGIIEKEAYLVWEPYLNRFGKVAIDALWDGNG